MSLSNLSLNQLEQAIHLLKEREALQSKLNDVNRRLQRLEGGEALHITQDTGKNSVNSPRPGKRRRRKLQPSILKALNAAGAKGLSVKDLASQIKRSPASVRVWLYTTGKEMAAIKKVAPGVFSYAS